MKPSSFPSTKQTEVSVARAEDGGQKGNLNFLGPGSGKESPVIQDGSKVAKNTIKKNMQ